MNKPNFRPIEPLDADDSDLERVNERLGVPTMVRALVKASQQDVVTASRQPVTPPSGNGGLAYVFFPFVHRPLTR